MQVIIADIDGTVVEVTARLAACLREIGAEPGPNPSHVADELKRPLRGRFFELFLSEKYTDLDTPIPEVVAVLRELQESSGLPLIFLTGRPVTMRKSTAASLDATGLKYDKVHLRPMNQRMRKTTDFKVDAVRSHGYEPAHIFDDDIEILTAFRGAFPDAILHLVTGAQTTPWPD